MIYLHLFFEFFRTGLFAVGGGLATIPFLEDMGSRTGWFTASELTDMIAVSESTPGPMGVNMATYVGYATAGLPGTLAATFGLVAPSVIIVLIVARFLAKYRSNRTVDALFYGLRPASCAMIAAAGLTVVQLALIDPAGAGFGMVKWEFAAIAAAVFVLTHWVKPAKKLHPIVFILLSAAVGIVLGAI